ncbi:MAG: phosphonate metabolism protein/1,5-bisphosphokinase (PRPP-forming) PhnN [Allorhizobium sp.]
MDPAQAAPATGTMVAVVGPSGAGKDTLLAIAMAHFARSADVHFVQRIITRALDAGGEDHRCVSDAEFEAMQKAGTFAVDWDAHGLKYALPGSVHHKLATGHLVVANGSRSVLDRFADAFQPLVVVNITAAPEILASRLEARGRESRDDILKRLKRGTLEICGDYQVVTIDNSGDVATAGQALIEALERVRHKADLPD